MPDGSYYIRNADDLSNAIHAIGRGSGSHADIRAHIVKRAKALGLTKSLPKDWNVTASALTADAGDLCDLLESTLASLASGIDTAFTLAQAIRTSYEAEETAEGDTPVAMMASGGAGGSADFSGFIGRGGAGGHSGDELFLTAAARGALPFPSDWFYQQEADKPTPLTVTSDGRVFGHIAQWDVCHTGFQKQCVLAPKSPSGYANFHVGQVVTADGQTVDIGKITVAAHHASDHLSATAAKEHYDHTGSVASYVRVVDGKHGIWASGSIEPEATDRQIRDLMANGPSGDWRNITRRHNGLDLIGILSVPKQGFPTARALVASAEDDGEETVMTLIAAGPLADCGCEDSEAEASVDGEVDDRKLRLAVTSAAA